MVVMSDEGVTSCPAVEDVHVNARGRGALEASVIAGQREQLAWILPLCGDCLVPWLRSRVADIGIDIHQAVWASEGVQHN